MSNGYSPEVMRFCRSELDSIFMPDPELRALCEAYGAPFLPNGAAASPIICDRIEAAIRSNSPLSVLRVGNGEGNAISMTKDNPTYAQRQTFFYEFNSQNGIEIHQSDAIMFCHDVRYALISADIIGFRSFLLPELPMIRKAIERGDAYAALGILYAREFIQDGLLRDFLRHKFITSAWIHLDLIPFLNRLFTLSESIIVITGRSELSEQFRVRLGSRLKEFITVPVQGFAPSSLAESHYYGSFSKVSDCLRRDLRGTLVLIGAGLFGKVYCNVAKMNGAVAVDLGSTFDVLAGHSTRPIHASYDLSGARWL
jgi:hypothetical protein